MFSSLYRVCVCVFVYIINISEISTIVLLLLEWQHILDTNPWICFVLFCFLAYFYHRTSLKEYDCFRKSKDSAFIGSLTSMRSVIQYTDEFYVNHATADESTMNQLEEFFYKLLRVSFFQTKISQNIHPIEIDFRFFSSSNCRSIYGVIDAISQFQMGVKCSNLVIRLNCSRNSSHVF